MTDGTWEAQSPNEERFEQFGIQRALQVVESNRDKPAAEIVEALYQAGRDFSSPNLPEDDVTIVIIKVVGTLDDDSTVDVMLR